jgi:hypothetical protein
MADIDDPIQPVHSGVGQEPSAEQVAMLADMGFTAAQARKALRETVRLFLHNSCTTSTDKVMHSRVMQSVLLNGCSATLMILERRASLFLAVLRLEKEAATRSWAGRRIYRRGID